MSPKQVANEIEGFIISQVIKAKTVGGVIGLSGGIDSTTVAWLAQSAFDKYNTENPNEASLKLYGLILPAGNRFKDTKIDTDIKDAITTTKDLGIKYKIIDINPILEKRKELNPDIFKNKYHYGNAASRERMIHLYGEAASKNLLVLGTGNRDEDYGIGYFTKYGDGGVDISPIGNLPKRLVRILAYQIGIPYRTVHREPSARLWPDQTDKDELGYYYDPHIETVTEGFEQGYTREEIHEITNFDYKIIDDVRNRHIKNEHKIAPPPVARISLNYGFAEIENKTIVTEI